MPGKEETPAGNKHASLFQTVASKKMFYNAWQLDQKVVENNCFFVQQQLKIKMKKFSSKKKIWGRIQNTLFSP
jgi:hypothetical protein